MQNNQCVFCKIARKEVESNIVFETDKVIALLDSDPINTGHILVIPKEHILDMTEMPEELLTELLVVVKKLITSIMRVYSPDGYSIVQNGGIFNDVGHFHMHIFPRYKNDGFSWGDSSIPSIANKTIADEIIEMLKITN